MFGKKIWVVLVAMLMVAVLAGCGGKVKEEQKPAAQQSTEQQELTGDALATAAKQEGQIVSYGMPDSWANLGEIWKTFGDKYGVKHTDTDMSSAEELAKFKAEKDKPIADVGDVGISFGPKGKAEGLLAAHKNPYWNEIPDWAKDPDGYWAAEYTGTIAFLVNTKKVSSVPKTWGDLLKPEFKKAVVIGDPTKATQAQNGVLASAIAFGGDETNVQPGIDFWAKVAKAGNLKTMELSLANIQKGEVPVAILWDFNALGYRKQLNMPELQVVIPEDGSVTSAYVAIINKYAPHPNAARLFNDYLFSDEAQIMYAKGFARPIRKVELPPEIKAQVLPEEAYKSAKPVTNFDAWENTAKELPKLWQETVLVNQ